MSLDFARLYVIQREKWLILSIILLQAIFESSGLIEGKIGILKCQVEIPLGQPKVNKGKGLKLKSRRNGILTLCGAGPQHYKPEAQCRNASLGVSTLEDNCEWHLRLKRVNIAPNFSTLAIFSSVTTEASRRSWLGYISIYLQIRFSISFLGVISRNLFNFFVSTYFPL